MVSLIVFALCWEQWLDYCVFLLTCCAFLYLLLRRHPELSKQYLHRVRFVALSTVLVTVGYVAGKLPSSGEHFTPGHESDTIFTYHYPIMAAEDVLSNLITYPYIAVSTFLPSFVVSSNSLYYHGDKKIIAEQHGYHPEGMHLVPMHHLFYWHFYAGMFFVVFLWAFARTLRKVWNSPGAQSIIPLVLLAMIGMGFTTHLVIKFRPYLCVPLLAYKCIVSVLGVALLLSYGLMQAGRLFASHGKYVTTVLGVWTILLIAAVDRFPHNNHLSQQVGLGEFPSPVRRIKHLIYSAFHRTKDQGQKAQRK